VSRQVTVIFSAELVDFCASPVPASQPYYFAPMQGFATLRPVMHGTGNRHPRPAERCDGCLARFDSSLLTPVGEGCLRVCPKCLPVALATIKTPAAEAVVTEKAG